MKNRNKIFFGFILIIVGVYLLSNHFGLIWFGFSDLLPILLIGMGIWLIIRRRRIELEISAKEEAEKEDRSRRTFTATFTNESDYTEYASRQAEQTASSYQQTSDDAGSAKFTSEAPSEDRNGRLKYNKFIGDMHIDLRDRSFQDIEISMFLSNVEINLTAVKLRQGLNRIVVSGFIGDIRVYVPKQMAVFANCSNFLGDIQACGKKSSTIGNTIECQSENYNSAEQKVYIAVNCFAGNIRFIEV